MSNSKLKTYRVSWRSGRERGAIGVMYPGGVTVRAASPGAAKLKAYETHEHLMCVKIEEVEGTE